MFRSNVQNNNLIIINPKLLILNDHSDNQSDNQEIERREKNTYYNKIININIDNEKNINK
jgi:hypothetical protein